jgi:antitoxin CptB
MSEPESDNLDLRRRRLLYRARHRGTAENDLLIGRFVARHLAEFSPADLDRLEELLETPDVVLADWLTGRLPIPPEADGEMLHRMRAAVIAGIGQGGPEEDAPR